MPAPWVDAPLVWGTAAPGAALRCPAPQHGSRSSLLSPAQEPVPLWPTNVLRSLQFLSLPSQAIAPRAAESRRAMPCWYEQLLDLSFLLRLQARVSACRQAPMPPHAPSPQGLALIWRGNVAKSGGPAALGMGAAAGSYLASARRVGHKEGGAQPSAVPTEASGTLPAAAGGTRCLPAALRGRGCSAGKGRRVS